MPVEQPVAQLEPAHRAARVELGVLRVPRGWVVLVQQPEQPHDPAEVGNSPASIEPVKPPRHNVSVRRVTQTLWSIFSRATGAALTVFALASTVFFSIRLLPGDPAALVLGDLADEASKQALRTKLHLDESLAAQFARFVWGLLKLDLGESLRTPGLSASHAVVEVMPFTASLAFTAVVLGSLGGVLTALLTVGPWLGRARGWVHRINLGVGAVPLLGLAPVATYFLAVRTQLVPLPGDPSSGVAGLLFASTLLAIPLGAQVARVARAALLEVQRSPFLLVAKAKGASPFRVWVLHAIPVCVAPLVAVISTQLGALLGGAVVLERLFERPGLGSLLLEAYSTRDLPVLQACIVASGSLFVVVQVFAAILHAIIDPRVESSR